MQYDIYRVRGRSMRFFDPAAKLTGEIDASCEED